MKAKFLSLLALVVAAALFFTACSIIAPLTPGETTDSVETDASTETDGSSETTDSVETDESTETDGSSETGDPEHTETECVHSFGDFS